MKTLTEVIEDAERCLLPFPGDCLNCPHFDSADDDLGYDCQKKILRDAVGYLREYQAREGSLTNARKIIEETYQNVRNDQKKLKAEIERYQEAVANCNSVETKYTLMVKEALRNDPLSWDELLQMEGKPVWVEESAGNGLWWTYWVIWQDENAVLPKEKFGTDWQAYRKERK